MASGVSGLSPILAAWMANNSETHYRRATSVALAVFAANSVCFGDKYTIIFSLLISLSGWHFKYLEFSNQGRTKVPQNNNYESHVVRDKLEGFSVW